MLPSAPGDFWSRVIERVAALILERETKIGGAELGVSLTSGLTAMSNQSLRQGTTPFPPRDLQRKEAPE